jgi:uncharacterized protein YjbI with pentapeptide repeats
VSRRLSLYEWLGVSEQRWTKKPNEEVRPAKTAWDWLQILIVPIALAAIGYAFNHAETARDHKREDARASQAQFIAAENRRDQVLQDYLARMGDLVLERRLRKSEQGSDVRGVARTLTLTALRRLDGKRKGEVVRFLADSKLIDGPGTPILTLRDADLRGVVLTGARLTGVVFDAADLRDAKFGRSALDVVRFEGAELERASFARAILVGVAFTAAGLKHVSFREARMENARSYRGALERVSFDGACLSGATFNGSDARRARFARAEGIRVSFDRARVTASSLEGAKLADSALGRALTRALPEGWTKDGAPLTADQRRALCTTAPGNP